MGRAALPEGGSPSVPPGEILVQMSDTQRHLNSDLEVVVSPAALRRHSGEWAAFQGRRGPNPPRPFSGRAPCGP